MAQPWKQGKRTGIVPVNVSTGNHYNGINVLVLWAERQEKGWPTAYWLTYKQCQALGGQVRAGEKSAHIIYANKVLVKDEDEERRVPFLKCYSVFNAAQCDGLAMNEPEPNYPSMNATKGRKRSSKR